MKKLFLVLLLVSCAAPNNNDTNNTPKIRTSINIENDIANLKKLIDSTKTIQLEIGENGEFIFDIDKILFSDNYLFIVDKLGKQIVKYDDKGNYIFSLSKRGNGNGEYITFCDATLIKNNLYILDAPSKVILKYSAINGDFIEKIKINEIAGMSMNSIDGNLVIFNENNDYFSNDNIVLIDTLGQVQKTYMPISKINKNSSFSLNTSLFVNNNKLFLINSFDNFIYEVDNKGHHSRYNIDYGDASFPESKIKKIAKSDVRDKMLEIESLLSSDKYSFLYDYYSVFSDYIIGTSTNCKKKIYSIYNINKDETINIDKRFIPIEYRWFIAAEGNVAYSRVNYPVIRSLFDEKSNVITTIKEDILKHFATADKVQTNPLLVKTYFKSQK